MRSLSDYIKIIYKNIEVLKKEGMDKESIFNYYLNNSDELVIELFRKVKNNINKADLIQARRSFEVITFALLKSNSYNELVMDLMEYICLTKTPIQNYILKYINLLHNVAGIKIEKWKPKIIYGIQKYSDEDVKLWISLYEELGSYNHVKDHIKKTKGKGPADTTIKDRIYKYFNKNNQDFNNWEKKFKRNIKLQKHNENEIQYWIRLFEEIGSFHGISSYLEKTYNLTIASNNIKNRIKKKFIRESKNFKEWQNKFRADNPTTFKQKYRDEEINEWIIIFEEIGYFNGVSSYLKNNHKAIGPDPAAIKYRIQKKFEKESKNYDEWFEKYKVDKISYFQKQYSKEDVEEWKKLYEEIGSFSSVSKYLSMIKNNFPSPNTISQRLKNKFRNEGENFQNWNIDFFSPNNKRANNIGKYVHNVLELIFIKFCLEKGYNGYYEISPTFDRDTKIDNTFIDLEDNIKMINIDYTISKDLKIIYSKFYKNYQSIDRILIIVLLTERLKKKIPKRIKIPHYNNIKLVNGEEFARYIGYRGKHLKLYNEVIEYISKSLYDDHFFKKLELLSRNAELELLELSKIHPITQKDLEKFLSENQSLNILKDLKFRELSEF